MTERESTKIGDILALRPGDEIAVFDLCRHAWERVRLARVPEPRPDAVSLYYTSLDERHGQWKIFSASGGKLFDVRIPRRARAGSRSTPQDTREPSPRDVS